MRVIVEVVNAIYFHVRVPCGTAWVGMIRTNDTGILLDRSIKHVEACPACAKAPK